MDKQQEPDTDLDSTISNSITQIEVNRPVALLRSKNYLDLDNESRDLQRQKLNLSAISPSSDLNNNNQPNADQQHYEQSYEYPDATDMRDQYCQIPEEQPTNVISHHHDDQPNNRLLPEPGVRLADECRLDILRNLLKIERLKNEQRRKNNVVMQSYLKQLQADYLRLQQDQLNSLELGHRIKIQRESQIEALNETLKEKETTIERLGHQLSALDEVKVREEFNGLLAKQKQLAQVERQQLKDQIATLERQVESERENHSESMQKLVAKLEDQDERHRQELQRLRDDEMKLRLDLEKLLNEPQNLVIRSLREDKQRLEAQLGELNEAIEQDHGRYETLKRRVEMLMREQEQLELDNEEKLQQFEAQANELKSKINEMKSELDDKDETIQIMQFNLTRSEKRVRSLVSAMRQKESNYKKILEEVQTKRDLELTKLITNLRSGERRILELENQLTAKQNEIVRLNLEQETKLESMRTDRDQRINKLMGEKDRYERDYRMAEIKLAQEIELGDQLRKTIEQLEAEVDQFKQESKRLSLELTKTEAKLFNKQQELNQVLVSFHSNEQEMNRCQMLELDLEDSRHQIRRLEETIDELRNDNQKLGLKLRFSETKLSDLNGQIKKEHAKFLKEFEKKLESIKMDQSVRDKQRIIKYKKCGHKLKKYCNNLRQMHEIN